MKDKSYDKLSIEKKIEKKLFKSPASIYRIMVWHISENLTVELLRLAYFL